MWCLCLSRNERLYCFFGIAESVVLLFTSGGVVQTFFSFVGFSVKQIGIYLTMVNVVQVLVMLFGVFWADHINKVKSLLAWFSLSPIFMCVALLALCFFSGFNLKLAFFMVLAVSAANNMFVGLKGMISYRLPYYIMNIENYEKVENIKGIIGGIISIGIVLIISAVANQLPYNVPMCGGLALSIVLCAGSCYATFTMKFTGKSQPVSKFKFKFKSLVKREFTFFYLPNLARGLASGLFGMMTVVYLHDISDNSAAASLVTVVVSLSAVFGSVIYRAIGNKIKTKSVYLLASALLTIMLPATVLLKNPVVFFIAFSFCGMGYGIIAVSASVYAMEIVDSMYIGSFSAMRLIMIAIGQAIGSYLVGAMLGNTATVLILSLFGMCQLLSGILYYAYPVITKKQKCDNNC